MITDTYSELGTSKQYYGYSTKFGAQIPLNFNLINADKNNMIQSIDEKILLWLNDIPKNMVANWVVMYNRFWNS